MNAVPSCENRGEMKVTKFTFGKNVQVGMTESNDTCDYRKLVSFH